MLVEGSCGMNINVPAETRNPSKIQYITNTFLQFVPCYDLIPSPATEMIKI
jgi:hypothetical protein